MAKTTGRRTRKTRQAAAAGSGLDEYRAKRDFTKTPEPQSSQARPETVNKSAGAPAGAGAGPLVFCVQKHDATRLHYDVRLEIAGALMSFAVPKGPSYDPKVKRLAVETEDHPMMYADFEARIPDGQYGAGDMLLWDVGTYETVPPGQEEAMRAKGHLHVRFFGDKLRGGWHFVKTRGRGDAAAASRSGAESAKAQWLMFKATDEAADPARDIVAERPESVKSGKSATRGPRRVGASEAGKSAAALVHAVGETMRASLVTAIDDVAAYSYELKYDGYRLLAAKAGDEVSLVTRGGHDWTTKFPIVARAVRALPVREAVIDGEVCVVDDAGRPSFQALQAWIAGETKDTAKLGYVTFDLLWLDGRDLRGAPLEERRELLEGVLGTAKPPLGFSRATLAGSRVELARILEAARAGGLEGIVAKRRGSKYTGGTGGAWRKLKFEKRQDCVIIGWVPMTGAAGDLGALMLAVMDGGALRFAGRVGTGFDGKTRARILAKMEPLAVDAPAVTVPREQAKGVRWVKPELVCDVAFGEWTNDGSMRRSSFVAMREDKTPEECTLDGEEPTSTSTSTPTPTPTPTKLPKLSNPDKVLFPRDGITKREILAYYLAVAPYLLPHLASRPLTLQRWPDGIDGEAWYQQNAPEPLPPFVHVATFEKKKRVIVDNVETLAWLANLAALTIHQWSARVPHLDRPDYVILDLDPGDKTTWHEVIEVARAVRTLLDALSLESAVKTSGKRGIHIVVPLASGPSGPSHEAATAFGERIAEAVAKVMPKVATALRMKEKRKGLLYVDYLQNGEGKTIVAPYTIRALDGAPVSTPLAWSEVTEQLDPTRFTIRTVLQRLEKHGDLFAVARSGKGRLV